MFDSVVPETREGGSACRFDTQLSSVGRFSISRSLETELAVTRRANELLKAQVMSPKEGSRRWG